MVVTKHYTFLKCPIHGIKLIIMKIKAGIIGLVFLSTLGCQNNNKTTPEESTPVTKEVEYVEKHLMKDKLEDGWYSLDQKGNDFFGNALQVNDTTITLWEEWKLKAVFYGFKNIETKDGWTRYNYAMDGNPNEYYVQYKRNEGEDTYSFESEWVAYSDDVRIDLDMANYSYVTLRVLTKEIALKKH